MLFQIQFRVMEMEIVENVENVGDAGGGKKLKPKNPKSKIGRLFNDYDDKHVKCTLCSKMIMVTDYSTKGLREHIKRKHKTQWNEIKEEEQIRDLENKKKTKKARLDAGQQTLEQQLNKFSKCEINGPKQKQFDLKLLELIGCNLMSFQFIESPEFHEFVQC